MAKKIYNREKIENEAQEPVTPDAPQDNASDEKTAKKRGFFSPLKDFFTDPRLRCGVGVTLALIGVYMLVVFISFFRSGAADQSVVQSYGTYEMALHGEATSNWGSILGANLANAMIARGIGISAFIVVLWCLVMGLRLTFGKQVRFFSYTLVSMVSIITCSMVLSALTYGQELTFFPLGGNLGAEVNALLITVAGFPGMAIVNVVLAVIWVLVCFNTIAKWFVRVKALLPKRTRFNDADDSEEPIDSTITDGKEDNTADDRTVTEDTDKEEDSEPDPFDVPQQEPETEPEAPFADDITPEEGKIEIAPEIQQSENTTFEAFDPTKELSHFKMPTIDLLLEREVNRNNVDIDEQEENKRRITETLANYNIPIKQIDVCVGPTITLFEIIPADGVRIAKIKNLESDIALSLAALGIRIIAPIPGKGTIGIEVPNHDPQTVSMRSVIGSKRFQESHMELPMALGCTIDNRVFMADLTKMPHLLVAGATGQGKSVGLNAIITSLLYKKHPAELKFVLVDPKMVEFSLYAQLDHHYLARMAGGEECIITDSRKVVATLNSLVQEMEDRYQLLRDAKERNIKDYNRKFIERRLNPEKGHHFLPYIVVIVDEFSDLIMVSGKEVERPIVRIAQKARAVGIHMIIATQRPSTNVITGIIKANFPGRIAFRVSQMVDSRTILDCSGAQQLVGKGDMLFQQSGMLDRVQCAFVDTPEVEAICEYIGNQVGYSEPYELPEFIGDTEDGDGGGSGGGGNLNDRDSLFEEAAAYIVASDTASTSSLQRRYQIGYNRAGRIMDQLEAAGIVGPSQGGKPRRVLVDSVQLAAILDNR